MTRHRPPIARLAPRWVSLLALLLSISNAALGEDLRQFNVEVIVFEHAGAAAAPTEIWRQPLADGEPVPGLNLDALADAKRPRPPLGEAALFELVPTAEYQLKSEADALRRSARYNILMHSAWRQPGLPPERAIAIEIDHPLSDASSGETRSTQARPAGVGASADGLSQSGPEVPLKARQRLEGTLRLHLTRYLHLAVDLSYFNGDMTTPEHQFLSDTLSVEVAPLSFHLQESRRLRSGELHYFDHPVVGVIALVTPYEPPQAAASPSPEPTAAPAGTNSTVRR